MMVLHSTSLRARPITVADYELMIDAGIFADDELRTELIDGELFSMSGPGVPHASCVNRLTRVFTSAYGDQCIVSVQSPLKLSELTLVQPDVTLLLPVDNFYGDRRPTGQDALLVVEVADTTLRDDLAVKAPRYGRAGVPEMWVVDVNGRLVHRFRGPMRTGYAEAHTLLLNELLQLPDRKGEVRVGEIVG